MIQDYDGTLQVLAVILLVVLCHCTPAIVLKIISVTVPLRQANGVAAPQVMLWKKSSHSSSQMTGCFCCRVVSCTNTILAVLGVD